MTSFGGPWTQEKLAIIGAYLNAYTTALKNQPFQLIYVDAFAGEGYWQPDSAYTSEDYKDFTELLDGSPAIALGVRARPFDRFVFIENDDKRSQALDDLKALHSKRNIKVIPQDANRALLAFCKNMDPLDRAVVFLDPFATQVSWDTVSSVAHTKKDRLLGLVSPRRNRAHDAERKQSTDGAGVATRSDFRGARALGGCLSRAGTAIAFPNDAGPGKSIWQQTDC